MIWRRSTRCESHECTLVAVTPEAVHVKDSKLGDASPILSFPRDSWTSFVESLKT